MAKKFTKFHNTFQVYFEKCWNPVHALSLLEEPSTVQ